MKKIFKYTYDPVDLTATMPEEAWILRADYVDDGFYKGHFVWAVVTVGDENTKRKISIPPKFSHRCDQEIFELRVKEKQVVSTNGSPIGAGEVDGKIYVICEKANDPQEHEIAVFKTGQVIDVPVEKLKYLGFCRLWIVQELCLYSFIVNN